MPEIIPFEPGNPKYQLATTIDGAPYLLDVRWNDREGAEGWYFDILDEDGTHIADGLRIVLGAYIGRHIDHALFKNGVIVAVDTGPDGRTTPTDATLDDITTRVQVRYYNVGEILGDDPDNAITED